MERASFRSETYVPEPTIISGDFPRVERKEVVVSGAGQLAVGTVLGRITASGKLTTSLSAAENGSQTPVAILAESVDATAADAEAIVYLSGEFNAAALVFGTGHTAASTRLGLRGLGIYI